MSEESSSRRAQCIRGVVAEDFIQNNVRQLTCLLHELSNLWEAVSPNCLLRIRAEVIESTEKLTPLQFAVLASVLDHLVQNRTFNNLHVLRANQTPERVDIVNRLLAQENIRNSVRILFP